VSDVDIELGIVATSVNVPATTTVGAAESTSADAPVSATATAISNYMATPEATVTFRTRYVRGDDPSQRFRLTFSWSRLKSRWNTPAGIEGCADRGQNINSASCAFTGYLSDTA
jgi:hypothetical protein